MKIVSLLPSATEIVYALGLGDDLIGVTDECDFPSDAVTKPIVSRSALPQGRPLTSREIDAAVRERMDDRRPLYVLDTDLIRREQPDVILTQDLCRVCAVPAGHVEEALAHLGLTDATKVVSLDPNTLDEVIGQIEEVGALLGAEERGTELAADLRGRIARAKQTAIRLPTVNVFCMEWAEPPFAAGHWVPEMVEAVGATNLLGEKGEPSRTVTHREIRDAYPEVLVYMPCGYYLEEAEAEGEQVVSHPEIADTPAVRNRNAFAVDATSFFSRPGPRIVDGLEILAWAVHPEAYPEPPPGSITRL
ncbi:MAG: cobalamin-binding protein [Actinomycetota bacterium]